MFEMICKIPANVGWVAVGAIGMLCVVMLAKLGRVVVEMIKDHIEEKEFWKVHHCDDEGEE